MVTALNRLKECPITEKVAETWTLSEVSLNIPSVFFLDLFDTLTDREG